MGITELLILISILVIVAIVLSAIVGAMNSRKNKIKIVLEKNIPEYDLKELELRELPNGGARMVQRSFEEVMRQASELDNLEASKRRVPRSKVLKTDLSREAVLARRAALLAAGGSLASAEQVREPDLFAEMPPAAEPVAENVADVGGAAVNQAAVAHDHAVEDELAAVLFADAEAAAPAVPDMPRPTPVWAAAAMRADEYDARTQSSNQDYVDDNEWLDDVSPVREVNIDRSVRAEPSFGDMRFDENLGLVELDSQPLIPMASPASVELVDAAEIEDLEQEFDDAPEPDHEIESALESEPETHQATESAFVFGSAIAPQSEFDLEMANDALADDQDNFDDQDDDQDDRDF